jgi:D-aspartate ligase
VRTRSIRRAGPGAVVIGGDYQGLGIVRSLGRYGIPVVVVDDERSIARVSRFCSRAVRVPALRTDSGTLDALDHVKGRFGLDGWVLYPTRDETVAVLSRHRDELSRWFRVPTPGWDTIRAAWDKRETYRLAEKLDIATPDTWIPTDAADLDQVTGDGPFIVKPAIKENFIYATRAKAWRAGTLAELRRQYRRAADIVGDGEVIVQRLVPGDNREQYSYCAFFSGGETVAAMTVCRRRQHPSDFGRASTFVETVSVPDIEEPSVRFLRETGYYGLVELEYKLDPGDGRYKLLDVNARTWGYHSLGRVAGVDFPYLLYRDQMDQPVTAARARDGVRWIRLATDVPNAVVDLAAGRLHPGAYLRSFKGIHSESVFSMRDPLPGLYEVGLLPYLAIRRGL